MKIWDQSLARGHRARTWICSFEIFGDHRRNLPQSCHAHGSPKQVEQINHSADRHGKTDYAAVAQNFSPQSGVGRSY